jgi:hypothetical protein
MIGTRGPTQKANLEGSPETGFLYGQNNFKRIIGDGRAIIVESPGLASGTAVQFVRRATTSYAKSAITPVILIFARVVTKNTIPYIFGRMVSSQTVLMLIIRYL